MFISYLTLLTSATIISLLPPLGYASPTNMHGHGYGTHLSAHNAEKRNHQCTTMFKRRAW